MAPGDGHDSKTPTFGNSDFVVVANRLPVDLERLPDGTTEWRAQSRRAGHRAGADAARPRVAHGSAGRASPGRDRSTSPSSRTTGSTSPVALSARRHRALLRGLLQRHAVAALPRRRRARRSSTAHGGRPTSRSTSGSPTPPSPRSPTRARRSGCRTTSSSWSRTLLRELRPDLRIGFFLHIPFPPAELFMQLPWRTEIIEGLLGADLVGFHLTGGRTQLPPCSRHRSAPTRPRIGRGSARGTAAVDRAGRARSRWRFPISIDSSALDGPPAPPRSRTAPGRSAPSSATRARSLLGVDRLDYTKGIDVRLQRLRELLAEGRAERDDTVMVQIATPSRERVESYQIAAHDVEREVGRINGEYAEVGASSAALPAPVAAARRARRVLRWPPTSCWSPRCATA